MIVLADRALASAPLNGFCCEVDRDSQLPADGAGDGARTRVSRGGVSGDLRNDPGPRLANGIEGEVLLEGGGESEATCRSY